jgi:putative transposase
MVPGLVMRNPLQRLYGRGDLHLVTFSCYRRRPFLGTPRARHRFVKVLDQVRNRFGFLLIGYVVMPEHVHLVLSEPKTGNPSKVLQVLKQKVARALLRRPKKSLAAQLPFPFPPSRPEAPAFWQRRFYDFNVWSEKKLREKLDYMHRNPVQRKLVLHPKDWLWSSWSDYERGQQGMIRIDTPGSKAEQTKPEARKLQRPHP